jgi:LysR family hydrogen peroxide-inducible transcriptional activator
MIGPLTLRHLRYLAALVEHRHFGRAAAAVHVTQPTLSAALAELEAILGVRLVERTNRRVVVTPLGLDVAARAREILRQVDGIGELARAAREPLSGPLRLGVIPTIGPYLLPRLMPALRRAFPRLSLYLKEDLTARLLAALMVGELDVLLIALPYAAEGIETLDLAEDPFVVACPAGHPLARRRKVATAELAEGPLLLLADGHCLRDHALAACRLAAARPHGFEATSLGTLIQMVANGLGVTLLPRLAVDTGALAGTEIETRELADGGAPRHLGLAWRATSGRKEEFRRLGAFIAERLAARPRR